MKEKYEMAVMDSFLKKEISIGLKDHFMEIASGQEEFLRMVIKYLEKDPSKLMELFNKAQDDHAI